MDNLIVYGPCALFVITLLIQVKIFARYDALKALEANLIKYMSENYVPKDIYSANHKALQEQISQIHQDVSDVKNLLISIINSNHSRN